MNPLSPGSRLAAASTALVGPAAVLAHAGHAPSEPVLHVLGAHLHLGDAGLAGLGILPWVLGTGTIAVALALRSGRRPRSRAR